MNLEDIQLREEDFNLLMEALESLPEKGRAGVILADLLGSAVAGDNPYLKKEIEKKTAQMIKDHETKNKERADDITLLKSKLILLKRFLQTNGALKTAEKIINKK